MVSNRTCCVYVHTVPNGKVYVGITSQSPARRWKNGFGYKNNEHFFRAILKYGWDNIKHEIVTSGVSRETAQLEEKRLIKYYMSNDPKYGYNYTTGGDGGFCMSEDSVRKMVEHHKYKRGKEHPLFGKKHSDKTKSLQRDVKLGSKNPMYGVKGADNPSSKPVCMFSYPDMEFIGRFESVLEACASTGIPIWAISRCCNKDSEYSGRGKKNKITFRFEKEMEV